MTPSEINGYRIVRVKFDQDSKAEHYLYLKEHSVRDKCPEKPADRTLFVLGVPPYATGESLTRAFSICGEVQVVHLHSRPTSGLPLRNSSAFFKDHPDINGFKVAYVVFENSLGLSHAMSLEATDTLFLSSEESPLLIGFKKWCYEYNKNLVNVDEMKAEIEVYMSEYDRVMEEKEKLLKEAAEPDDDGWITVTKKGRKPGFARKESVEKKILAKEKLKRSKKQLLNFYRFQIRESKMNHLINLRDKFEEDKKKIARMKQIRKFKPF